MITREQLLIPGARFRVVGTSSHYFDLDDVLLSDGVDRDGDAWFRRADGKIQVVELKELVMIDQPAATEAKTLRDEFAMAALPVMAARADTTYRMDAEDSYAYADAMLSARAKVQP